LDAVAQPGERRPVEGVECRRAEFHTEDARLAAQPSAEDFGREAGHLGAPPLEEKVDARVGQRLGEKGRAAAQVPAHRPEVRDEG